MEQASLRDDLDSTRQQIADMSALICRQRVFLAESNVARRNAAPARESLAVMEAFLACLADRRNRLEQELLDVEQSPTGLSRHPAP
jgi:hypothetical protein